MLQVDATGEAMNPYFFMLLACLALPGCQTVDAQHLKGSARTCLTENASFVTAWACVRTRYAGSAGADSRIAAILAEGERLSADVLAGRMYDVDARAQLSTALVRDLGE